jgi:hypothetical protein
MFKPKKSLKEAVTNAYNKALGRTKSSVEVDYTVDNKNVPFKGSVTEGKRKAIMNVSNPEYGSRKSVDTFNKYGGLKSQKFVDKDASGKTIQVTKRKVDKSGNMYDRTKYKG